MHDFSSLYIRVAQLVYHNYAVVETPQWVTASRIGLGDLHVSWEAVEPVAGYEVFCVPGGSADTTSKQVTTQTSLFLAGISPTMRYSVFVVAFGNGSSLPSPRSSTAEIYPSGEET